jgi:4-hydroxythreonine-4-phosphate dehydrogenase
LAEEMELELSLVPVSNPTEGFELEPKAGLPVLELETPASDDPPGGPSASFGMAAVESVLRAGTLCLTGKAAGMVTPPLSKESMHKAGYVFEGQTQILGELCNSRRYGMLACNGNLKVLLATRHISLREVVERLEIGSVAKQIRIAHEAARGPLGLENPRIVLAGLNPHAGENGAFGKEERKVLRPAMQRAEKEFGFRTSGPAVPDVVFADAAAGKWDIVIALYHDQGFIPLKFMGRKEAWTLFVGGDLLRTSPMHGTAWDIARTGKADYGPFAYALSRCIELSETRMQSSCCSN